MSALPGAGMGQPQYDITADSVNVRTVHVPGDDNIADDVNAASFDYPIISPMDVVFFLHNKTAYFWTGGVAEFGYGSVPVTEDQFEALTFGVDNRIEGIEGLPEELGQIRKAFNDANKISEERARKDTRAQVTSSSTLLTQRVSGHEDAELAHNIPAQVGRSMDKHTRDLNPHACYVKPDALLGYSKQGYAKLIHSGAWEPGEVWEDWHTIGGWIKSNFVSVGMVASHNYHGFVANEPGVWQASISIVLEHAEVQMNRSLGVCIAHEGGEPLVTSVFGTHAGATMTNVQSTLVAKISDTTPIQLRIKGGYEYRKVKVLAATMSMVRL